MLELLILYSLNKKEQTLYGLKKYISSYFGEISNPSHGALHPALKRLIQKKIVSVRKNFSDGGKRYTYYEVTGDWEKEFENKCLSINSSKTQTFENYLYELKIKLFTIDVLNKEQQSVFKEKNLLKLDYYKNLINEKFKNAYLELNENQKKVLYNYLEEEKLYRNFLHEVK